MPGDPLRAKLIAETHLENPKCFNTVWNMLGYTGNLLRKAGFVMGQRYGMPLYRNLFRELFHFYGVENISALNWAGGIADQVQLRDLIAGIGACTDSITPPSIGCRAPCPYRQPCAKRRCAVSAAGRKVPIRVGNVLSSDLFYGDDEESLLKWKRMGVLAVEMEAAALYMNAARCGKNALPSDGFRLPAAGRIPSAQGAADRLYPDDGGRPGAGVNQ